MRMPRTIGLSLALLVASSAAMAKQNQSAHHGPVTAAKAKPIAAQAKPKSAKAGRHRAAAKPAARSARRHNTHRHTAAVLPPGDQYVGQPQPTGQREIGMAAWYGRHHIGMRTASGELLDAVRATAAHRSLPLHSLVRVTNLRNGRSVIAKINDRGPVSRSLLIDVSPRAADELAMKSAGLVEVMVEPVAPAAVQTASQTLVQAADADAAAQPALPAGGVPVAAQPEAAASAAVAAQPAAAASAPVAAQPVAAASAPAAAQPGLPVASIGSSTER